MGKKTTILKLVVIECIYEVWQYRNAKSFGNDIQSKKFEDIIIDTIVYGWWNN